MRMAQRRALASTWAGTGFSPLHQAQHCQHSQPVLGEVDFPPAEPLPHRAGKEMMIVVPALAEGQQR